MRMSVTVQHESMVHSFQDDAPSLPPCPPSPPYPHPPSTRRSSLLNYFQRRFLGGAKGLASLKRFNVGSCPNLAMEKAEVGKVLLPDRLPLRTSRSTDPNKLHVPNFFVTSSTHSREWNSKEWKIQSSSSPDLGNKPKRPVLRKAVSVTTAYEKIQRDSRHYYRDGHICQVLDFLFLGDLYCAYNPHILCRLGIKRIIDISDTRPQEVPQHIKSLCACPCRPDVKHSRPKLYIDVEKTDTTDIGLFFHEINRFIENARTAEVNVLVHSYEGSNRAPCVVIQYLMAYFNMDLRTAIRWVQKCRPQMSLNSESMRALQAWEIRCVPSADNENSLDMDESLSRRLAWSDC